MQSVQKVVSDRRSRSGTIEHIVTKGNPADGQANIGNCNVKYDQQRIENNFYTIVKGV
jgi:hypothetical protein